MPNGMACKTCSSTNCTIIISVIYKSRTSMTTYVATSLYSSLKTYIIVFSTSVTGITISIHINIHIV